MPGSDVFLTGATGFIGWSVLDQLARSGRSVTALVRQPTTLAAARTVVGELNGLDALAGEISDSGAIVHLACGRGTDGGIVVYQDILGMAELVYRWRQGAFVFASTALIHGDPRAVLDTTALVDFNDWHHAGKAVNEFQLRDAVDAGISGRGAGVSLRPCLYFGRSHRPPYRQVLNSFFFHAQAGRTFTFDHEGALDGAGVAYIGDTDYGRAVVAALDHGTSGGYPVASGFVSYRDLVDTINRVAGTKGKCVVRRANSPDEVRVPHSRVEIDSSVFIAQTGWQPQQGLEELVNDFVVGEREAGRA